MAQISFPGLKRYEMMLSRLSQGADAIAGKAIHQGAAILADQIRANIRDLPSKSGDTRDGLLDGLGIAPLREDGGYYNVKIGFDGYNRRGIPNPLMARVLESGTSRLTKRPFLRPAVNAKRKEAEAAMAAVLDREIKQQMQ